MPTIDIIVALAGLGWPSRRIADGLDLSHTTVLRQMTPEVRGPCPCGRPSGHNGWCHERIASSPSRLASVARSRLPMMTDEREDVLRALWPTDTPSHEIFAAVRALPGGELTDLQIRSRVKRLRLVRGINLSKPPVAVRVAKPKAAPVAAPDAEPDAAPIAADPISVVIAIPAPGLIRIRKAASPRLVGSTPARPARKPRPTVLTCYAELPPPPHEHKPATPRPCLVADVARAMTRAHRELVFALPVDGSYADIEMSQSAVVRTFWKLARGNYIAVTGPRHAERARLEADGIMLRALLDRAMQFAERRANPTEPNNSAPASQTCA